VVDTGVLDATAAELLAAARAPSAHTLASYGRRWRMWEGFALHHGVPVLPAEPEHVASFVVARWRVGVSEAALAANLSAVLWFHRELASAIWRNGCRGCCAAGQTLRRVLLPRWCRWVRWRR
jgi:site-specific recombinase XerC